MVDIAGLTFNRPKFTTMSSAYVLIMFFVIAVLYIVKSVVSSFDKPAEYLFPLAAAVDRILEVAAKIMVSACCVMENTSLIVKRPPR